MPKRLREYPLYIAPGISGVLKQDGSTEVCDEIDGEEINPNCIEDKIKIYERQVKGWFLGVAKSLTEQDDTNFVVLMVCLAYVEGVEQYRRGQSSNGNSRVWFREGIKRIFNLENVSNSKIDKLYGQGRCGLFHVGMSGGDIVLSSRFNEAINFTDLSTITINTDIFLNTLIEDFTTYIIDLKDQNNQTLRDCFDRMYTLL